ncbi:hypothetical protein ACLB2K_012002 [Fragaria x ananassa]
MGLKVGTEKLVGFKLNGIVLVHPYFWGEEPIGGELALAENTRKMLADLWRFCYPLISGTDDPFLNPGKDPKLAELGCGKVLVCVAEKDSVKVEGCITEDIIKITLPFKDGFVDRLVWKSAKDVCSLCHNNVETARHLFLHCSFATNIWGNLLDLFQGMIGVGFYAIWHARNALHFQELIILSGSLLHSIKMQLHEINFLSKGTMKNTVGELCILHRIGIKGRPSKAPKIVEVMWHVPSIYQVKLNTNGAARGSPGLAGFGDIFRDHLGQVLVAFFEII